MKHITIIGTLLLTSSMSFAIVAHKPPKPQPSPTVECFWTVDQKNEDGSSNMNAYKNGEPLTIKSSQEDKTTVTAGFVLKGSIQQQCAMHAGKPKPVGGSGSVGGGSSLCVDSYDVTVKLAYGKQDQIVSMGQYKVKKADKDKRYTIDLIVGNVQASANCDVK